MAEWSKVLCSGRSLPWRNPTSDKMESFTGFLTLTLAHHSPMSALNRESNCLFLGQQFRNHVGMMVNTGMLARTEGGELHHSVCVYVGITT